MTSASIRRNTRGYEKDPFASVYPRIWIGAACQFTPKVAETYQFTHVINCAEPHHAPKFISSDRVVSLSAIDHSDANILHWYPRFESVLDRFLRDPECRNVYVHCECGINRSAFLVLAYVVDHFGMPFHETAKALIEQRPCALTNPSFWRQVEAFAKYRASKHGSVPQ